MRKLLDGLYAGALALACLALATIALLVLLQVGARALDRAAMALGFGRIGLAIPSLAEFGAFLFVAAAFLALPATLRGAGHVRVTLLLRLLGPRGDRLMTLGVLLAGLGLALFAAWHAGAQAAASWARGSVSYGLVPVPLWLPQSAMVAGLALLAVALLDEAVAVLRGRGAAFRAAEAAREGADGGH